jgi:hypothetical protein
MGRVADWHFWSLNPSATCMPMHGRVVLSLLSLVQTLQCFQESEGSQLNGYTTVYRRDRLRAVASSLPSISTYEQPPGADTARLCRGTTQAGTVGEVCLGEERRDG